MRSASGSAASRMPAGVPSPLEGEGYSEVQRRRMGEGSAPAVRTPHPFEYVDPSESPSPSRGEGASTTIARVARSPLHRKPAIHRDRGAGDEIRGGAREKHRDAAENLPLAPAPGRRAAEDALVQSRHFAPRALRQLGVDP